MKKNSMSPCVIIHENGRYYTGMTGIGPCFGSDNPMEAMVFNTRFDAGIEMSTHYGFISCAIVAADFPKPKVTSMKVTKRVVSRAKR